MKLRLNKAHFPVTALGPGDRIGIWVQGCSIGCEGCVSRDTWEADQTKLVEVESLLAWCRTVTERGFNGVTISGGEPFQQPDALGQLLDGLLEWRRERSQRFDILCYSGYKMEALERHYAHLLAKLDAVIPEPFIQSLPRGNVWRGSANQPLVPLTDLGRSRYADAVDRPFDGKGKFQFAVDGEQVWYIGIPERGDMEKLGESLSDIGISQHEVSWTK